MINIIVPSTFCFIYGDFQNIVSQGCAEELSITWRLCPICHSVCVCVCVGTLHPHQHVIINLSAFDGNQSSPCWFQVLTGILMSVFSSPELLFHFLPHKVSVFARSEMEWNKKLHQTISNASIVGSIMMLVIITFGIGEMGFPYWCSLIHRYDLRACSINQNTSR